MTLAAKCPECGVMGSCICPQPSARKRPFLLPEEPSRADLPSSPAKAYAEGYREGFVAGLGFAEQLIDKSLDEDEG
jgi:hypothetical protein